MAESSIGVGCVHPATRSGVPSDQSERESVNGQRSRKRDATTASVGVVLRPRWGSGGARLRLRRIHPIGSNGVSAATGRVTQTSKG